MLGFRDRDRVQQACLGEGGPSREARLALHSQLQKQTSACSYLRFLHLNDPGGRHNDSSMSPQGTWLLNVMQHETGDFVMKLEERKRVESRKRTRKTNGKPGEEEGDDTKIRAIFPTPPSSSPSKDGDLGHVSKDYLPKPCLHKNKIKIKINEDKPKHPTNKTKNPHNYSWLNPDSLLKYFPLTASLHQEQLMATISLLWKENFC